MLAKLSALLSSKVAIAAIGGALVLGGGATVAAAETGHLPANVQIPGISHSHNDDSHGDNNGDHGDGVAVQGTLTAYDATHHTITVTGKAEDSDENDNENDGDDNKGSGTPTAGTPGTGDDHESGTPTAHATGTPGTGDGEGDGHENGTPTAHPTHTPSPTCNLKSPFTIALNGDTKINGQAKSESDLAKNIGSGVEVQANEGTNCALTAAKVTVQGKGDDNGDHQGKVFVGAVGTVGASSFTLQPEQGNALTVNVSSTTRFEGVKGLSGLTHGMHAAVMGTQQSNGSISATMVAAQGTGDDHGGSQDHKTVVGGQVASVDTAHSSFVVTTLANHNVTVHVSPTTSYEGDIHGLGDLKAGMGVAAEGTLQSDGSLQATQVAAEAGGH